MIHSRAFHSFTTGLREGHEEDLGKWEKMVRDWEMDNEDSENPYDYAEVEGDVPGPDTRWVADLNSGSDNDG
jgi:hypothetical protein